MTILLCKKKGWEQMLQKSLVIITLLLWNVAIGHAALPKGFVYLDTVDPTIQSSLRYTQTDNFIGRPVDGYKAPRVILTKEAANALKKAQAIFKKKGYSI